MHTKVRRDAKSTTRIKLQLHFTFKPAKMLQCVLIKQGTHGLLCPERKYQSITILTFCLERCQMRERDRAPCSANGTVLTMVELFICSFSHSQCCLKSSLPSIRWSGLTTPPRGLRSHHVYNLLGIMNSSSDRIHLPHTSICQF